MGLLTDLLGDGNATSGLGLHESISATSKEKSHTTFNTVGFFTSGGWARQSADAVNSEVTFEVLLAAGTYTLSLAHTKLSSGGIFTVSVDGTALGTTIDNYAASTGGAVSTITGIVIPETGLVDITLSMLSKNASSTGHIGMFSDIYLDGVPLA